MKKIILLFIPVIILFACSDENDQISLIKNGCYEGHFDYENTSYWCSICFDDDKYVEWPSGGAYFQKSMSCLTVGTFSIEDNVLSFELDSFKFENYPETCETNMLLPGSYEILYMNQKDSLVFKKGNNNSEITYYLKK